MLQTTQKEAQKCHKITVHTVVLHMHYADIQHMERTLQGMVRVNNFK